MICKGIRINWSHSVEYVHLDLENIGRMEPIKSTIEWWKSEREWVKYNTIFKAKKLSDGSVDISLTHEQKRNPHLSPSDICFGVATINIGPGQQSGEASWDDVAGPEDSGTAKWVRIEDSLIGERKRETVSRIQRAQEKFRSALVVIDEKCVLSGERTVAVLEAAHIVPVKSGGAEVIENGILLRADLHKLFDAGLFTIGTNGAISTKNGIGKAYIDALKGKRLPDATLRRVRPALEYLKRLSGSI